MPLKLAILTRMSTYSSYNIVMIEEQNQKLEDEKKALQFQLEKQMQNLKELSSNVLCYAMQ